MWWFSIFMCSFFIVIAVVLCLLAVCVFVIFSLNVHFICLEIKNNLIIYRINIHIELCCGIVVVVALRERGTRSRTRKYYAVSFHSSATIQLLFIVWCCRHCWHERVQIAICFVCLFVCLSVFFLYFSFAHLLVLSIAHAFVFVVKMIHLLSICRQCPVHGIEYQ